MEIGGNMSEIRTYCKKNNFEKTSYLAYVPNEKNKIWLLGNDESSEYNFTKYGIEKIVEMDIDSDKFSLDSVTDLLEKGYEKVRAEKIFRNQDFTNIELNFLKVKGQEAIFGNIGHSKTKIFREERILEEISGDVVKKVVLNEGDFVILGTNKFWDIVENTLNYNEKEFAKELKYNVFFMQNLTEKIYKIEKIEQVEIPFIIVYLEKLNFDKKRKSKKFFSFLPYFIIFLLGIFAGKFDYINSVTNKDKIEKTKIEKIVEVEKIEKMDEIYEIKREIEQEIKREIDQVIKKESKKIHNLKKIKKMSIDEEIEKNWILLGRDSNGNILEEGT